MSKKSYQPYVYLFLGFVSLCIANGRFIIPLATLIAPVFLIRFMRCDKPFRRYLFVVLAGWISNIVIWRDMLPMEGFFYYIVSFVMSLTASLTYLIDRYLSKRIKGFISTLIFPSLYVLMEFIVISTNPSGSFGTISHTQSNIHLMQILSITGIWGVTFLVFWIASVINYIWDSSFDKETLKTTYPLLIVLLAVFVYGQIRIKVGEEKNETVRIASIIISKESVNKMNAINNREEYLNYSKNSLEEFITNCIKSAHFGAKIIFGSETILNIPKEYEEKFLIKAKELAKEQGIYIGLPMAITFDSKNKKPENKITWISPEGLELFTYHKVKPLPGEGDYGDGLLKFITTPYGNIGTAICFDMNFPSLFRQLRNENIDIMLVPANDWREISPYHTFVSSSRAIENGFSMVRACSNGLSASFDMNGRIISKQDYFSSIEQIFITDVGTKGVKTIYSAFGDYFAYLCILFLIFVIIKAIIRIKTASS